MEDCASFGEWIRRRRKALDLTQCALAACVGCAVITIKKIEADERRPSRQFAERLADCLEIAPDRHSQFVECARGTFAVVRLPPPVPLDSIVPHQLSETVIPTNLPVQTTMRVGRDHDITLVIDKLKQPQVRLLTLTGPGGVGKTRLALEVGAQIMPSFPDGIFFVPLASIRDPMFVTSEIAKLFGISESTNETLSEKLVTLLRPRRVLVILDNLEHLLDAGPLVADLLSKTLSLKVLVTSREALNVSGEHLFVVKTLRLPPINASASELVVDHSEF